MNGKRTRQHNLFTIMQTFNSQHKIQRKIKNMYFFNDDKQNTSPL